MAVSKIRPELDQVILRNVTAVSKDGTRIRPGYFTECYCSKQDGTRLDQVILRNVTAVSKMVQD